MAVYSCNYPIWHPFDTSNGLFVEYRISVLINGINVVIYAGKITPYNTASLTTEIDISEVCREFLNTFYENRITSGDISTTLPIIDNIGSIYVFTVMSGSNLNEGAAVSYTVKYDYNTDFISVLPDSDMISLPLDNQVDARQRVNMSCYNTTGSGALNYSFTINDSQVSTATITGTQIHFYSIDLSTKELNVGDKISLIQGGNSVNYEVVRPCRNRFCLYYVNKYGGLDHLLCTGKHIISWEPARTDVRLYDDRGNRLDWQQKRIYSEQDKQYELNTGFLKSEKAELIDNLIYSPKVFIHDLEKDTITSCLITNTTYTVKSFRNDRLVFYTIKVKQSQKELRR